MCTYMLSREEEESDWSDMEEAEELRKQFKAMRLESEKNFGKSRKNHNKKRNNRNNKKNKPVEFKEDAVLETSNERTK